MPRLKSPKQRFDHFARFYQDRRDQTNCLIARETETVYHGCICGVPDFDEPVRNLDTVYDGENLMNQRGAVPITDELVALYREPQGLAQDIKTVEARFAGNAEKKPAIHRRL